LYTSPDTFHLVVVEGQVGLRSTIRLRQANASLVSMSSSGNSLLGRLFWAQWKTGLNGKSRLFSTAHHQIPLKAVLCSPSVIFLAGGEHAKFVFT
jgi:hypothetical protein